MVANGNCGANGDNVTWSLDDNVTLTISGTGAMGDYTYNSMPWYDTRSQIQAVVIGNGVTSIGQNAFNICNGLADV